MTVNSCWKWWTAESYSFFLNIKSANIWKDKQFVVTSKSVIFCNTHNPFSFIFYIFDTTTTHVLTIVAASFSFSFFKRLISWCWHESRSSVIKYNPAKSSITCVNSDLGVIILHKNQGTHLHSVLYSVQNSKIALFYFILFIYYTIYEY